MTPQELQTKANNVLTQFWALLQTKQDAYFAKTGKYFQLLVTDSVVDGEDTTWELRTPSDERFPTDVDFTFNSPVPFSISVDEWIGDMAGYSAAAIVELPDGRRFSRSLDSEQNDTNWIEI